MSRVERTGASAVEHSGALRLATRDAPADRAPPADLPPDQASLRDLLTLARAGLHGASMRAEACGMPGFEPRGQLIRPLAALAAVPDCHATPDGFWDGALAVQLAHEASLVHDDIVDGADTRRGEATLVARRGTACALLRGDHLLTAAYCAAARTGSIEFAALFARAVERTVAGEVTQGRATGAVLTRAEYEEVALGKAGELLGCALAIAPVLLKRGDAGAVFDIGCRLGLLYQMVDDLLDYCPHATTGKQALGDYRQARWTWILDALPDADLGLDEREVLARLHQPAPGGTAMQRCLAELERVANEVLADAVLRLPSPGVPARLVAGWLARAAEAVAVEQSHAHRPQTYAAREPTPTRERLTPTRGALTPVHPDAETVLRARVPRLEDVDRYLARNSRSFHFASRLFPRTDAARVARVYAYCRITDDIADNPAAEMPAEDVLDAWTTLSRRAYDGSTTSFPLLDAVMREMSQAGVPFTYAAELAEGMRMDLRRQEYATLTDLRRYTYRVASVVGLWLTRLFGVHDAAMLNRAERMGHAMQLTNILRDVGEDLDDGRMYLPAELRERYGVTSADLARMRTDGRPTPGYIGLVEDLLHVAEDDYDAALAAVPALPASFGRPVAVAAHVYRGIHHEIRNNGYDNLRQRAHTSAFTKCALGAGALLDLFRSGRRSAADATSGMVAE